MNYQQGIRINARQNQRKIIGHLEHYYLNRENGRAKSKPVQPICSFCCKTSNITAEHVLPRWVFEKDARRFFNTTINGLSHKYNQTTVPACATCNNNLLSELEKRILQLFLAHQRHQNFFNDEEKADVIRWLELLDYKYQVFSLVTKFRALKGKGAIEFLSDYSFSVLDPNIEYSPAKAMGNLRESLHRITIKSKKEQLNSLVTFRTKNPDTHFFHKNNDFIFLELPKYKLGFLYFYKRSFVNELEAKDVAMETIKQHY